jgi:hypothetical protein
MMRDTELIKLVVRLCKQAKSTQERTAIAKKYGVPRSTMLHWMEHPPEGVRTPYSRLRRMVREIVREEVTRAMEGSHGHEGEEVEAGS